MTDIQFERLCNVMTGILILMWLFNAWVTFSTMRARSVKEYQERVRQDKLAIEGAQEDYTFQLHIAIVLWIVCGIGTAFRIWAYIVHGV